MDKLKTLTSDMNLDSSQYRRYKAYLDDGLGRDKRAIIKNIAITGKYGSGKSSIIDTYFKDKDDFLRVSFATFKRKSNDKTENNIFANIINQIIYQVDVRKIPLTKFKVKSPITQLAKVFFVSGVLLILLSWLSTYNFGGAVWFMVGRIILSSVFGVWLMWIGLSKVEFSRIKFSWKNVETDIDMSRDDLFEKYTDEIIYLFQNSGKRILIIEDLDRFDDLTIFEKLRELNTKLNYQGEDNWQFIYLIKDNLFINKNDRVKFFDQIIPIIPFITTNNSFDKLRELFPENNVRLLQILGIYVDDYRLLVNISNEYKVYNGIFKQEEIDQLLALIAYKNLYPSEFDDLQNGKGKLAKIMKLSVSNIQQQINNINQQIQDLKNSRNETSIRNEVDYLLLWSLKNNLQYVYDQNGNRNNISSENIAQNIIKGVFNISRGYREQATYSQFKEANPEYTQGLPAIVFFNEEMDRLRNEKIKLEKIKLVDIDRNIYDFKDDDILFVLIKNGFITQEYLNIINHYYGDLTNLVFMKNLYSEKNNYDINMKLTDIKGLFIQIQEEDFKKEQILNIDFFSWLLKSHENEFVIVIKTAVEANISFIEEAINSEENIFDEILKNEPNIKFDLAKLNKIEVDDIIFNNRYLETKSNMETLIGWLKGEESLVQEKYIKLLNNDNVYTGFKKYLINSSLTPEHRLSLDNLNDSNLWTDLMDNNLVVSNSKNLMIYYQEFDLDEILINFVNSNKIDFTGDYSNEFYEKILQNNKIDFEKFKDIWNDYNGPEVDIESLGEFEDIDKNRISYLLNMKFIKINIKLIEFINNKNMGLDSKHITRELKKIIIDNEITVKGNLLDDLLAVPDESTNLIFSRNLPEEVNKVQEYLEKIEIDGGRLLNIIKKTKNYQNLKILNNEFSQNLLEYLQKKEYISGFENDDSDSTNKFKIYK